MSNSFLEELAQARPDPGGGAAAAYGAALGLALLEKVVRLELHRPQTNNPQGHPWQEVLERVHRISEGLDQLREEDVRAYFHLTEARAEGRPQELLAAVREAVQCPVRVIQQAQEALTLLAWTGKNCKRHLVSDLLVACEFLGAALRGASHIAGANLHLAQNPRERQALARELARACQPGRELWHRVKVELGAREYGLDHCG
jgi:formiminotetrahydrofolate cyclodeaminase